MQQSENSSASTITEEESTSKESLPKKSFLRRVLAVERDYYKYRNVGYLVAILISIVFFNSAPYLSRVSWAKVLEFQKQY